MSKPEDVSARMVSLNPNPDPPPPRLQLHLVSAQFALMSLTSGAGLDLPENSTVCKQNHCKQSPGPLVIKCISHRDVAFVAPVVRFVRKEKKFHIYGWNQTLWNGKPLQNSLPPDPHLPTPEFHGTSQPPPKTTRQTTSQTGPPQQQKWGGKMMHYVKKKRDVETGIFSFCRKTRRC